MTLHEVREIVWQGALADRARLWSGSRQAARWPAQRRRRAAAEARAQREGIIAYSPSHWLGRALTTHESRLFAAAVAGLERDGRIRRIRGRRRVTHIELLGVVKLKAVPT